MNVVEVIWDLQFSTDAGADEPKFRGHSLEEIEVILKDARNQVDRLSEFHSNLGGVTWGRTSGGEMIGVVWESECGNPMMVMPIGVIRT